MAVSADESGETALDWLMAELVEDGDEVVAIRVIELDEGGGPAFPRRLGGADRGTWS